MYIGHSSSLIQVMDNGGQGMAGGMAAGSGGGGGTGQMQPMGQIPLGHFFRAPQRPFGRVPAFGLPSVSNPGGAQQIGVAGGPQTAMPMRARMASSAAGNGVGGVGTTNEAFLMNTRSECITQLEPVVLSQRWTVSNFGSLLKLSRPGACLRSNVFRDPNVPDACWQLCLYPGGKREENANHVSLFLKMSSTAPMKEVLVKAEYRFYFLDENDTPRFSNVNVGDFHAKPPKGGHSWGLRNIPKQKVANCVRNDGALVISCIIELIPDVSRFVCKRIFPNTITDMHEVSHKHTDEELDMLRSEVSTDTVLELDNGKRILAHRFKLIAHSPVFRAMFDHAETTESIESRVHIKDFDEASVRAMLEFMYTGRIEEPLARDTAADVLQLADKYDVSDLRTISEQALIDCCDMANACDMIELAELHRAKNLYEHCIDMIASNRTEVLKSASWAAMRERNGSLHTTILEHLVMLDQPGSTNLQQESPPLKRSRL